VDLVHDLIHKPLLLLLAVTVTVTGGRSCAIAMAAFVMNFSLVLSGAITMAKAAFVMSFSLVLLFYILVPSHWKGL
ncbi:hypothetical protein, partial [Salmonella enterica]|uniref:hypothetical protein n=1 Tax=Salmonella enterica TaxID=28901 RepID=UPI0032998687